eukprot:3851323-Prymnesium_polylepis.1
MPFVSRHLMRACLRAAGARAMVCELVHASGRVKRRRAVPVQACVRARRQQSPSRRTRRRGATAASETA